MWCNFSFSPSSAYLCRFLIGTFISCTGVWCQDNMNKCLGIQYPFPLPNDLTKYSSGISKFQLIKTQSHKKKEVYSYKTVPGSTLVVLDHSEGDWSVTPWPLTAVNFLRPLNFIQNSCSVFALFLLICLCKKVKFNRQFSSNHDISHIHMPPGDPVACGGLLVHGVPKLTRY